MSAPEKIWAVTHSTEYAPPDYKGQEVGQWKKRKFTDATEYTRTDLSQAAVAAALEAALNNIRELNMTGEDENGLKWANSDLIEQEIVFALSTPATEPQGYVVKPLVWVPEDAPCTRFKAEALGGHMMIVELDPKTDPGKYSVGFDLGGLCFKFVLAEYDDFLPKYTAPAKFEGIEAAKAAAKADYEARILSAIIGTATPAPSDKIAEAARE